MDRLAASNPFAPGSGQLPPYLGGREDEQRALRRMLSYVEAGRSTPRDIAFEDAELHRVVEASQRYPFFLQLCGEALWDEAAESGNVTIDSALVDRALAVFERKKTTFYQIRYGELGRSSMLLSAAEAVAAAFAEHETLVESQYSQVIAEVLPPDTESDQAIALGDHLKALGYVWIPPGSTVLEPGLPNMLEFARSKVAA